MFDPHIFFLLLIRLKKTPKKTANKLWLKKIFLKISTDPIVFTKKKPTPPAPTTAPIPKLGGTALNFY
ncbi:UNVERIFIED_CONTAM: hypothetical protein DVV56_10995, partial [Lactobacillus acidophilus]|nr:hypothetical protein [Lactobacillus acidophilus]